MGATIICGLSGRRTSLGVLQCFWGWCLWVRQSRLLFETWVETMGAMARPRLQGSRAVLWWGQVLWPQPLGRGWSWSLSRSRMPRPLYPGSESVLSPAARRRMLSGPGIKETREK